MSRATEGSRTRFGAARRRSRAQLVAFADLTAGDLDAWQTLRASNPALDSPFFHPEYAAAVDKILAPVVVAVQRGSDGHITALLPGHRRGSRLEPVGSPLTDFQGPIVAPDEPVTPEDLVPIGIREIRFDHFVSPGPQFDRFILERHASPLVDASCGLAGYLQRAPRIGQESPAEARRRLADTEKRLNRRYRKAERELGPLRFVADTTDTDLLNRLIVMKRGQYQRTGVRDVLASAGARGLITHLLHVREPGFRGMLSALYAGEHLLAIHFGLRSATVLNGWFSVYEPRYRNLGPFFLLLRELIRSAPALGLGRVDFGKGDEKYKQQIKTDDSYVCDAALTRSSAALVARRLQYRTTAAARSAAIRAGLRPAVQAFWRSWNRLSTGTGPT